MVGKKRAKAPSRGTEISPESAVTTSSGLSLGLFLGVAVIWAATILLQEITPGTSRLTLFVVADQLWETWWDGPATARGLIDRLQVAAVGLLVLASAAGGGWLLLRNIVPLQTGLRRSEKLALGTVIGLGIQGQVLLGTGLLGWYGFVWLPWLIGLIVLGIGFFVGKLWGWCSSADEIAAAGTAGEQTLSSAISKACEPTEEVAPSSRLPLVIFGLFSLLLMLRAILPPAEYDVREYHLQSSKEWFQSEHVDYLPHNIYANMPMGAEIQSVQGMMLWRALGGGDDAWWWGALVGKLLIASYAVLCAILVGGAIRLFLERPWECQLGEKAQGATGRGEEGLGQGESLRAARWGAVLALGFPGMIEGASVGLIEAAVGSHIAGGILLVMVSRCRWNLALLGVTALLAGLSLGYKYTALVFVVPALVCLVVSHFPGGAKGVAEQILVRPRRIALLIAAGLAGSFLWYGKNAWLTGNPVYPLAGQWLGGVTLDAAKIEQWNQAHRVPPVTLTALWESFASLLWRWRYQDWLVVPLAFFAVLANAKNHTVRVLLAVGLMTLLIWWGITHRVDRFVLPVFPLLFVLAGIGCGELYRLGGTRLANLVLLSGVFLTMVYDAGPGLGDARLCVDLRYLRVDDGSGSSISRMPVHQLWVNRHLSPLDKVLVVGDAAVFDYEVPVIYSTTFDRSFLRDLLDAPSSKQNEMVTDQGITHLLVHWGEIARLRATYGFDETIQPQSVQRLVESGLMRPVFQEAEGRFEVWQFTQPGG